MGPGAAGKQPWPGCTALAVLLHHNAILVANSGQAADLHRFYWISHSNLQSSANETVMHTHDLLKYVIPKLDTGVSVRVAGLQETAVLCCAIRARPWPSHMTRQPIRKKSATEFRLQGCL